MRKRQLGVSFTGLIIGAVILIFVALLGMRVGPPYMEFFNAKKLIAQVASEGKTSVGDIRQSFDLKSSIDNVTAVKPADLEITKDGNEILISFSYRKEIPLFANVGLYLDFAADSKGRDRAP